MKHPLSTLPNENSERIEAPKRRINPLFFVKYLTPKRIGILIALTIIGTCLLSIYIMIQQPPALWEPFKGIVNNGIDHQLTRDERSAQDIWQNALSTISEGYIELTEQEVSTIISSKAGKDTFASISQDKLELFVDLDRNDETTPLWLNIMLDSDANKQLVVQKIRTGLVATPTFLNSATSGLLQRAMNGDLGQSQIIYSLLGLNSSTSIKSIDFIDHKLRINLDLKLDIDDLFPF